MARTAGKYDEALNFQNGAPRVPLPPHEQPRPLPQTHNLLSKLLTKTRPQNIHVSNDECRYLSRQGSQTYETSELTSQIPTPQLRDRSPSRDTPLGAAFRFSTSSPFDLRRARYRFRNRIAITLK